MNPGFRLLPPHEIDRRRLLRHGAALAVGAALVPASRVAAAADASPLEVGLAPFLSPAASLRVFRPMRDHLARVLDRPVEVSTARDMRRLVDQMRQRLLHVMLMPPHLARLATTEGHYRPLVVGARTTTALVMVRENSPWQRPEDLRGARIGSLDPLTTLGMAVTVWLRSAGLQADRDYRFVTQRSGNSALYALEQGELEAVVVARSQIQDMPPDTPRGRVLKVIDGLMGPVYIVRAGLPREEQAAVRAAFLSFEPAGAEPITSFNTRLLPLSDDDLAPMEPQAQEARRLLYGGR